MNATELKAADPDRFDKEYQEWHEHSCHYDWWDGVEEQFKEECGPMGIEVDKIDFSLSYSQGDYATFTGRVHMGKWMKHHGYDLKYHALYLSLQSYGSNAVLHHGRSIATYVDLDYQPGNTYPEGVFSDLPQEAWDELCQEQFEAEEWEQLVLEHVRELESDLYDRIEKEYEYLTSEEQFIEHCECNDVTFDN